MTKVFSSRRVQVMRDHKIEFPALYAAVFITGASPHEEAMFATHMFTKSGCTRAKSLEEADIVVFNGGVDVDPQLYGEKAHPYTERPNHKRDEADISTYMYCLEHGIPMLGICRGAQFLHVMNGGKLFQHVNNHNGAHSMWDIIGKDRIEKVSSVHHQMVRSNKDGGMTIIAIAHQSTERWMNDKDVAKGTAGDIEAFYYRDTGCLGIQGHPEYSGYPYFTNWALKQIENYFWCNPDFTLINSYRRMKPDLIAERDARLGLVRSDNQSIIISTEAQ